MVRRASRSAVAKRGVRGRPRVSRKKDQNANVSSAMSINRRLSNVLHSLSSASRSLSAASHDLSVASHQSITQLKIARETERRNQRIKAHKSKASKGRKTLASKKTKAGAQKKPPSKIKTIAKQPTSEVTVSTSEVTISGGSVSGGTSEDQSVKEKLPSRKVTVQSPILNSASSTSKVKKRGGRRRRATPAKRVSKAKKPVAHGGKEQPVPAAQEKKLEPVSESGSDQSHSTNISSTIEKEKIPPRRRGRKAAAKHKKVVPQPSSSLSESQSHQSSVSSNVKKSKSKTSKASASGRRRRRSLATLKRRHAAKRKPLPIRSQENVGSVRRTIAIKQKSSTANTPQQGSVISDSEKKSNNGGSGTTGVLVTSSASPNKQP